MSEFAYNNLKKILSAKGDIADRISPFFNYKIISPFENFSIGNYSITPLPAIHSFPDEDAFMFLIEKNGRTILYATDTGYFHSATDNYLLKQGVKIDLLVLDCTKGDNDLVYDMNMSMKEGKAIADRFAKKGLLAEDIKLVYTHFSHNSGQIYDDLVTLAEKYGFEVAYDGMEIEV